MTSLPTLEPVKRNKFPALAAAAAIAAAGILITAPVPAQAAPPCTQWGFPNGGNGFTNDIGQSLLFQAGGKTLTQAAASCGVPVP